MSISINQSVFGASTRLQPQSAKIHATGTSAIDGFAARDRDAAPGAKVANFAPKPATNSHRLPSVGANAALLGLQEVADSKQRDQAVALDTNHGRVSVDLDAYFSDSPATSNGRLRLQDIPILMPSSDNIAALSEHVSERFGDLLAEYGIPSAPETIAYDQNGRMHLPADYAYADELKEALKESPGLERELRTVNALTSHFVELQKLAPFHQEFAAARGQGERDAVLAKFGHLLGDRRNNSDIALRFSRDGTLELLADGAAVKLAA